MDVHGMFPHSRVMETLVHLHWTGNPCLVRAIRNFDREAVRRLLGMDSPSRSPCKSQQAEIDRLFREGSKNARKNRRRTWIRLTDLLERAADDEAFGLALLDEPALADLIRDAVAGRPFRGVLAYPLSPDELDRLASLAKEMPRLADLARSRREAEAAAAAALRREREAEAERARRVEEERRLATFRIAVEEALALSPVAGHKAILNLVDRLRCPTGLVPPTALKAAREWDRERLRKAEAGRVALKARKAAEAEEAGRQGAAPSSSHLAVTKVSEGFRVAYAVPDALALGSAIRAEDLARRLRAVLGHRRAASSGIEALFGNAEYKALTKSVAAADALIEAYADEPMTPLMVEEALSVTARERLKWLKDGRLPSCGEASFYKGRREIVYALHAPRLVSGVILDGKVEAWRAADVEAAARNRKRGAAKAAKTRERNEASREEERSRVDAIARKAALEARNLAAIPVIKLGILASLCSRWAKHYQEAGKLGERDAFYGLKDEALRIIARQPWAEVAYRPGHRPRASVDLCDDHREEFRDDRRMYGDYPFWDWVADNRKRLQGCKGCRYSEDADHYALYEIRLAVGPAHFSWHVPYALGRDWLPDRAGLAALPPGEFDGETGFMFGRPIDEDEEVLWPAARLRKEIRAVLDIFARAAGSTET